MIEVTADPLITERLELRPVSPDHAPALWPVLGDEALYTWIARGPPRSLGDLQARFARISQHTAANRTEQWLNWTVWLRTSGVAVGIVESTVPPSGPASIAYMFGRRFWGQGYASEAAEAVITTLEQAGVAEFEATLDPRNAPSRALVSRLGFVLIETRRSEDVIAGVRGEDEVWRGRARA